MSTNLVAKEDAFAGLILNGDLSKLSSNERVAYHNKVCESLGLNPLTRPFEYISMSGKLVLYAKRDATEQLRKIHKVGVVITSRDTVNDVYLVTAKAMTPDGRTDESIGAVPIANLKGEALANAIMKAETKAKRRVTLSICGLGMLDESEVSSIPNAKIVEVPKEELMIATVNNAIAGEYILKAGKYEGKKLQDIPDHELQTYVATTKKSLEDPKFPKEKIEDAKAVVTAIEAYLYI